MSSPNLPMVRTSERSTYKRCRWQWDREFNDCMKPETASPPLRFGSLVHKALATYYKPGIKRGPHPAGVFEQEYEKELEEQIKFGFKDSDGEWHDALEMGVGMLNGYVNTYGADERYKVIATEQAFEIPILDPKGKPVATYVGIVDGIWQDRQNKDLIIPDHKTAAAISVKHLTLDEQAGAYWTYGVEWMQQQGILDPKRKLRGMLYNFLRKAIPNPEHSYNARGQKLNRDGSVSKSQPAPYFHRETVWRDEHDRQEVRKRVLEEVREHRLVRAGKLTAYKTPGMFTCPMCSMRDICELHEAGADWEEMARQTMTTWNPYDEHTNYVLR